MDPKELDGLIESICKEFTASTSSSGGRYGGNASKPFYNFEQISMKIFGNVPHDQVPYLFQQILNHIPLYMSTHTSTLAFPSKGVYRSIALPHLVVETVMQYFMPRFESSANRHDGEGKRPYSEEPSGETPNKKPKRPRKVLVPCPVYLSLEDCENYLKAILPYDFPPESKLWKTVAFVLQIRRNVPVFGPIFAEAARNGDASFSALIYCMHDTQLNKFMDDASVILMALYSGPLKANTVEAFAAYRSDAFRGKCRVALKEAGLAAKDVKKYNELFPPNLKQRPWNKTPWTFQKFAEHNKTLMRELKGEVAVEDTLIHNGWAVVAVKKIAQKFYVEKTVKLENMYEVIWTVLCQRPNLQPVICNMLAREFNDIPAANSWKRFSPHYDLRNQVRGPVTPVDPLKETEEFLNFPSFVKGVEFVSKMHQLTAMTKLIDTIIKKDGRVVVGLDGEWNAYMSHGSASILQLAVREQCFILDLLSADIPKPEIIKFFNKLFMDKNILNLGFQFHEDLNQLRGTIPNCSALYHPENLVCIGKLIGQIMDKTKEHADSEAIKQKYLPHKPQKEKEEGEGESAEKSGDASTLNVSQGGGDVLNMSGTVSGKDLLNQSGPMDISEVEAIIGGGNMEQDGNEKQNNGGKSATQILSKGLSTICMWMLGRPLDKSEQCSLWDRRPLRPLQLRYGAMDAYCQLMLYWKCEEWAKEIGLDLRELEEKQDKIMVSLPLLSMDEE